MEELRKKYEDLAANCEITEEDDSDSKSDISLKSIGCEDDDYEDEEEEEDDEEEEQENEEERMKEEILGLEDLIDQNFTHNEEGEKAYKTYGPLLIFDNIGSIIFFLMAFKCN